MRALPRAPVSTHRTRSPVLLGTPAGLPQLEQNWAPAPRGAPQPAQVRATSVAPQEPQNFPEAEPPQAGQTFVATPVIGWCELERNGGTESKRNLADSGQLVAREQVDDPGATQGRVEYDEARVGGHHPADDGCFRTKRIGPHALKRSARAGLGNHRH